MHTVERAGRVLVALSVVCAVVSSCRKSPGGEPPSDVTAVRIQVSYDNPVKSRAVGGVIEDQTALQPGPGHIFFTGGAGEILLHVGVVESLGNGPGSEQVTLDDLTGNGAIIDNVPFAARKCYILFKDAAARISGAGGITGDLAASNTNISTVEGYTLDVSDMNVSTGEDAGGVSAVPLFGSGDILPVGGTTSDGAYTASVLVAMNAAASRIQIKKITGIDELSADSETTVSIESFTVEGIYINYYYHTMSVGGERATGLPVDNGSAVSNYASASAVYGSSGTGYKLSDNPSAGGSTAGSLAAGAGKAWAYNLLPTPAATADPRQTPHIVIRFSSVTTFDGTNRRTLENRFITIKGLKDVTSGDPVLQFDRNTIYTFNDIRFRESDLSPIPEIDAIDVLVAVEMMSWTDKDVVWDI